MTYGLLVTLAAAQTTAPTTPARAAFDHLKTMAGSWKGAATDGRKIAHEMEVIAGGTVVMENSWFEAHPGEKMVTMYHLDGDKLMLTHYCVAGNQPRLEATEISTDGRKILFTFRDATNIPSREKGHMDKALVEFTGPNTMKSQWTWYQAGKEQWMEAFEFKRSKSAVEKAVGEAPKACCPS